MGLTGKRCVYLPRELSCPMCLSYVGYVSVLCVCAMLDMCLCYLSVHSDHFAVLWQGFIKVSGSCGVVLPLPFDRCWVALASLHMEVSKVFAHGGAPEVLTRS